MNDSTHNSIPVQPAAPRLSAAVAVSVPDDALPGKVDRVGFIRMGILAALFLALHVKISEVLWLSWWNKIDWNHGILIPVFSLYLVYSRWGEIQQIPRRIHWPGLVLVVLALIAEVAILAIPPLRNYWLYGLVMVGMLFGLVLFLCGWRLMRLVWLPVVYIALAVPMSGGMYSKIAYPLQEIAATGAVTILKTLGVEITQTASRMDLVDQDGNPHQLTVAEACSGMHLLMAFFALGVATAYLESRSLWQRIVLVLSGVPIAVFCNVIRVAITCMMFYIGREEWGRGVLHGFTGMLMLIPAFGMLWALGWVMNRLFIEVDDDEDDDAPSESAQTEEVGA